MTFIIRIELHHTSDYNPLHAALARRGIYRHITLSNGVTRALPTGTYSYLGSGNSQSVFDLAMAAAVDACQLDAWIIVAEASRVTVGNNLPVSRAA